MLELSEKEYQIWRDKKLSNYRYNIKDLFVDIKNPLSITKYEKKCILSNCETNNISFIRFKNNKDYRKQITTFNSQLGLIDYDKHLCVEEDGLAVIENTKQEKGIYMAYSNKTLNWHTDGYYNQMQDAINAFTLYCINPAIQGGVNEWIDPEMLYIKLRDLNPDFIKSLSINSALTIPQRKVANKIIRKEASGPIFFIDNISKKPKIRFTQRKKNIKLAKSKDFLLAINKLNDILANKCELHHKYKLKSGEGLVCNNVLHTRSSFKDFFLRKRKLIRGRYKNTIQ